MADKPPFDMLRAAFWLLAVTLTIEMLASITGGILCWRVNMISTQTPEACIETGKMIRELWSEMTTAVLALLLAARSGPPPRE